MAACDHGNGSKTKLEIERKDWLRIGGFVLGLFGATIAVVVPLMMYIFQTRADAIIEHASIETAAALHEQKAELLRSFDQDKANETKAILRTLDNNQRELMRKVRVPEHRQTPLPAGITFDDIDSITDP